jgi:hypothetical protein
MNIESMPELSLRCARHDESIRDWSSEFKSPYRVVIHWRDEIAGFALHEIEYDGYGFPAAMSRISITPIFKTSAQLAQEARNMGLTMEQVSDIFLDRYLEYREFFREETPPAQIP